MSKTPSVSIPRPQRWDVPLSVNTTDEAIDRVLETPPFCHVDQQGFSRAFSLRDVLRNDARLVRVKPGDIIVREGDWGSSAFFVLSGDVRVEVEPPGHHLPAAVLGRREVRRKSWFDAIAQLWRNHREPEYRDRSALDSADNVGSRGEGDDTRIFLQDVPAVLDRYRTVQLGPGEVFGELAALGRTQRTATVFAETEGELLEIRWQGLRDVIRKDRDGRLRAHVDQVFRERGLETFLRACDVFTGLDDQQMQRLVDEAQFESFGTYDSPKPFRELVREGNETGLRNEPVIAEEGHYPNGVVLIRSGLARLSQRFHHGHRTYGYLTPGQVFGYEEIAQGFRSGSPEPLQHTLRAIGFLTAVTIPTRLFEEVVLSSTGAPPPARPAATIGRPADDAASETGPHLDEDFLEFLVGNRFVQGTATMLIDLDRCTRCDDCVRACAAGHDGNPRFVRHGPTHGKYMVANACMHCSDPICMIECPTGAIHRDIGAGSVVVNEQTCIGCTQCANNCPYDAIRMVATREADGTLQRDEATGQPLVQATKCDLCVEQLGGPACQRACPHDALVRVDARNLAAVEGVVAR